MNPLHRFVWNVLMRRRRNLRFVAARLPWLAPSAVRARFLAHVLVGNLHLTLALVLVSLTAPALNWAMTAAVFAVVVGVGEVFLQLGFVGLVSARGLLWLVGWREGWSTRAYLPAAWADGAAKTAAVQAEVGTNAEPTSSARLRPIADHPKLSLIPLVEWPTVSFWIGPPPGRTFTALDEMADILASHLPRCHSVTVEYVRETDSVGRISFTYADVLTDQGDTSELLGSAPPAASLEHSDRPALSLVEGQGDDLHNSADVVALGALPGDDLPESA